MNDTLSHILQAGVLGRAASQHEFEFAFYGVAHMVTFRMTTLDTSALGVQPMPLSRRLYHEMIAAGILTKEHRVELIQGQLIPKMSIGTKHTGIVMALSGLLFSRLGQRAVVSVQNPVSLHEYSVPEPDFAILRPPVSTYLNRLPEPADIFFLIEVADTSLRFDREGKVPLYASCDVPECWLVDLNEKTVTVYSQPDGTTYQHSVKYQSTEGIALSQFPEIQIPLAELGW